MPTTKPEIERFSVKSTKSFEAVIAALKAGVGRLDLIEFAKASHSEGSFAALENVALKIKHVATAGRSDS